MKNLRHPGKCSTSTLALPEKNQLKFAGVSGGFETDSENEVRENNSDVDHQAGRETCCQSLIECRNHKIQQNSIVNVIHFKISSCCCRICHPSRWDACSSASSNFRKNLAYFPDRLITAGCVMEVEHFE